MPTIIEIRVVPSAGKNKWELDKAQRLKCYLKSAPERGKANQELIQLLAKALRVAQRDIEIISGLTSRTKRVKIPLEVTHAQLLSLLGIEQQLSLVD